MRTAAIVLLAVVLIALVSMGARAIMPSTDKQGTPVTPTTYGYPPR